MTVETLAIIDLGTNTFHLLITEVNEREEFVIREKYKEPVNMGEGGLLSGKISDNAFNRGLRALHSFKKLIESKRANKVFAFATSAIRSASNGPDFVQQAREETGIEIRIINGNEEAALIFSGVKNGVQLPYAKNSLLVDIGGGSVEFIVARENKPLFLRSLDIGAARLLEILKLPDPVSKNDITRTCDYLREQMGRMLEELREFEFSCLVGSSGSFETLSAIIAKKNGDVLSSENLNNYEFSKDQFKAVFKELVSHDRRGRLEIPGMEEMRVDMIIPASIIIDILVNELKIKRIITSSFALKEGILFNYMDEKKERLIHLIGNTDKNLRAKAIRNLGKKFHCDQEHGIHVSELAMSLFDQLRELHVLSEGERELLKYGALLHDIGYFVNRSGHHKHGQYIVMNAGISGFSNDEMIILGNIIRYHRKSLPTRDHFHFKVLNQQQRYVIRALAGILRIADNLDRGHRHLVESVRVRTQPETVKIEVNASDSVDIEIASAMEQKELFEQVFQRKLEIVQV